MKTVPPITSEIRIETFDSHGDRLTSGSIFDHLNGEIRYNNAIYFFLGKEWYRIRSDFIIQLNRDCRDTIKQYFTKGLLHERFNIKDEDVFISKHFNKPGFLVLHKMLYDNIELCDLLLHDDNTLHLIHIKKDLSPSIPSPS